MTKEQQTIKVAGNDIPVLALENPYFWLIVNLVMAVASLGVPGGKTTCAGSHSRHLVLFFNTTA